MNPQEELLMKALQRIVDTFVNPKASMSLMVAIAEKALADFDKCQEELIESIYCEGDFPP